MIKVGHLIGMVFLALSISACTTTTANDEQATAKVTDDRTTQQKWADSNLEFEAAALSNNPTYKGKTRIAASAYRGTVLLFGQANTEELQQQFANDVEKVKGVNEVRNQVRVKPALTISQISTDSWITAKVKTALIQNKSLNGVNIKVITEDREVFLLGYVDRESASIAADVASNVEGVNQVIKAFVLAN